MLFSKKIHRRIYLFGLCLFAFSLLFSKFTLSISQFIIAINWILEGNVKSKFKSYSTSPKLLIISAIYWVHLVGFIYTSDFTYGLKDLRIKLPLLLLPLLIGTSKRINWKELKLILTVFIISVFASTLISHLALFGYFNVGKNDAREFSIFISHIRFGLLICIAIFTSSYLAYKEKIQKYRIIYTILSLWLIGSLLSLKLITGLSVFIFTSFLFLIYLIIISDKPFMKIGMVVFLVLLIVLPFIKIYNQYTSFQNIIPNQKDNVLKKTINGNKYFHRLKSSEIENGYLVWVNVSKSELEKEWEKRSDISLKSKDGKGQPLFSTLVRYLASKGLTKDSLGLSQLTNNEIAFIEQGNTNYKFVNQSTINKRLYEMAWDLHNFRNSNIPNENSIFKKVLYWHLGWEIFKENKLLGVGTGDLEQEFQDKYKEINSKYSSKSRRRTHNQYLSFLIAFGVVGFSIISFSLFGPLLMSNNKWLYIPFIIIMAISMITEDTLETQIGVSMFAYFNIILGLKYDN